MDIKALESQGMPSGFSANQVAQNHYTTSRDPLMTQIAVQEEKGNALAKQHEGAASIQNQPYAMGETLARLIFKYPNEVITQFSEPL